MLDSIVDKNENYEIVIRLNGVDYGFAYADGTVRLAIDRIPHKTWSVREIGSVELDATAMADISEDYEYENIRTSVKYSFADRFPRRRRRIQSRTGNHRRTRGPGRGIRPGGMRRRLERRRGVPPESQGSR